MKSRGPGGAELGWIAVSEQSDLEPHPVTQVLGRAKDLASGSWEKVSAHRFNRTPAGRARAARANGDTVFQFRRQVDDQGHGEVLSSIEAEGWELADTQHVQEVTSKTDAEGNSESTTKTFAVYMFRALGERPSADE